MAPLPEDLGEHAGTLVMALGSGVMILLTAMARAAMKRQEEKETQVAAALREVGGRVADLTSKLDELADRLFTRLGEVERAQSALAARCAALHGAIPGWDGLVERRASPRDPSP